MNRVSHIVCFLFLMGWVSSSNLIYAENVEHEGILQINYGGMWQQDQYLTPLLYKGMKVGLGNEWWQPYSTSTRLGQAGKLDNWQHLGSVNLQFSWTYSPARNNIIYSVGAQGGWGTFYTWSFRNHGVQLLLGPYVEVDYLAKLHGRNTNKPYSMDLATDIMAMGGVSYSFHGPHSSYRLRYLLRANLIGIDFMPDYWQSYYELVSGITGDIRFTGMWNHIAVRQSLTLDMQLPHSTWRVGIGHEYLEYGKDIMFSREQVFAVIGTCFRYRVRPNHKLTEF